MAPKYDKRRAELEPKLRQAVKTLNNLFPDLNLNEEEIVKKQLSDERFELHDRALKQGLGTPEQEQRKRSAYSKHVKSGRIPFSFSRSLLHMVKEDDTPQAYEYNKRLFKDIARDDDTGLAKRKQLALEMLNSSANVNYADLEKDTSIENIVEYSMKYRDQVGVAMELINLSQNLDVILTDKTKFKPVNSLGQVLGGIARDAAFLAQDDSFFTFPFEYIPEEQLNIITSKSKYKDVEPNPELGGITLKKIGAYQQIRHNLNQLSENVSNFKKAFPDGRPVFTDADFGKTREAYIPKGGYNKRRQEFFDAADILNSYDIPIFDEMKASVAKVRKLLDSPAYISKDQIEEVNKTIGKLPNMAHDINQALDDNGREIMKPVFAKILTGAKMITGEYEIIASLMDDQIDDASKELFGIKYADDLQFGVTESSRVGHILTGKESKLTKASDISRVSKAETFENAGDAVTAEMYKSMAKKLCELYAFSPDDKAFRTVIKQGRDFLTSEGRSAQQKALKSFLSGISQYTKDAKKNPEKADEYTQKLSLLGEISVNIKKAIAGNLISPAEREVLPDPADRGIGHIGIWSSTDDVLFPHIPGPNDVKQGLGIEDCYMLSALTFIAATNPQQIMDAMKDNGDGTVTVRFYNHENNDEEVFITVNKTVNKVAGANAYASSSLWVQMMEKAFIGYMNKVRGKENSFESINRINTAEFMNAFGKEKYVHKDWSMLTNNFYYDELYKMDSNGDTPNHPEGYLDVDNATYDFLHKCVDEDKQAITVGLGPTPGDGNADVLKYALDHGIRVGHAYSVMKTFEQNVDGKIKKFVQLRDPYATFSAAYNRGGKLINDSHEISATMNAGMDNMGTFNLELVDFEKIFNSFSGIPEKSYELYKESIEKCRKEALTPEEFDKCKLPDAPDADNKKFTDIENEVMGSIENRLNSRSGFNSIFKQLSDIAADLYCTDEWFVWTNTDKFTEMRDSLNSLVKAMSAFTDKDPSKEQLKDICSKFNTAAEKASFYTDKKTDKVLKEMHKDGKEPSLRAVHRLVSSINIKRLYEGNSLLPVGNNVFSERLGLVVSDINKRCEMFSKSEAVPHDQKSVDQMQKVAEVLNKYIAKKPEFINEQLLSSKAVSDLRSNISKMKAGEIKNPEPAAEKEVKVNKTEHESVKSDDSDGFVDIEII